MMLFRKCVSGVRTLALAAAVTGLLPLWQIGTAQAQVSIGISVNFPPPALPVYEQPLCPGEGYLWTPGYWAWDPDFDDYYWVPGTWVLAPQPGYLWTPPYWGWNGVAFIFHEGYWGSRIGFYGGIDYGYGYPGRGYYGGRWERDHFYYNRSVNNVNVTEIHNVYNKTVINNVNVTRVSYNGGEGGVRERASQQEEQAFRERHVAPVAAQQQHVQEARTDRALRASDNRGKPPIAATDRPGQFRGNVVAAREGRYNPPPNRPENRPENARPNNNVNRAPEANRPATATPPENRPEPRNDRPPNARGAEINHRPTYVHPNDLPKTNRPDRPQSSGNAKADQKYQQRSDNMYKKQEQERQNLEKKQEQQHARAEEQRANDARRQQMEHQHQQQTQKLEQRHQQQQEKMQRQAPSPKPQPQPKQQQPKQQGEKPHGR